MILLKRTIIIFFILYWPFSLNASGMYWIEMDQIGVYFQTDQDGGWYINPEERKYFRIGESGTYSVNSDRHGTYIITDSGRL